MALLLDLVQKVIKLILLHLLKIMLCNILDTDGINRGIKIIIFIVQQQLVIQTHLLAHIRAKCFWIGKNGSLTPQFVQRSKLILQLINITMNIIKIVHDCFNIGVSICFDLTRHKPKPLPDFPCIDSH